MPGCGLHCGAAVGASAVQSSVGSVQQGLVEVVWGSSGAPGCVGVPEPRGWLRWPREGAATPGRPGPVTPTLGEAD